MTMEMIHSCHGLPETVLDRAGDKQRPIHQFFYDLTMLFELESSAYLHLVIILSTLHVQGPLQIWRGLEKGFIQNPMGSFLLVSERNKIYLLHTCSFHYAVILPAYIR